MVKEKYLQFLYENDYKKLFVHELKHLPKSAKILNVACENELVPDFLEEVFDKAGFLGVEINKKIVESNEKISLCNVDTDRFPYADNSFDAIISIWGMEHFQEKNLFFEARRVLKSGGVFIFLTPNGANPAFLLNKLGGEWFGKWYYKRLLRGRYVPHRAYYRFNTRSAISKIAQEGRFDLEQLLYFGPSNFLDYFTFSKILQKLVSFWEVMITNRLLYFLKPYILVTFRKETK